MGILAIIGLSVLGIILVIGIIRTIISPYTGFMNFLVELMILDWLGDCLGWVVEAIGTAMGED
jgi:hypothetical protein